MRGAIVMSNCGICQNPVPRHQSFCSKCGARRRFLTTKFVAKQGVFARLKSFLKELSRSEAEKEAERHIEAGFNLCQYGGVGAAIPDHEEAVQLSPSPDNKSILAITYSGAGDERLGKFGFGGPLRELESSAYREEKAEEILFSASKLRQLEEGERLQYSEAYEELDKALNGALTMYDKSVDMDKRRGYLGRACAFSEVAGRILRVHGIIPYPLAKNLKGKPVQYGFAQLGICVKEEVPDLQFAVEIVWLYEHAEADYQDALRLDPTDAESYVGLSHVQQKLGKANEATNHLSKALAILNKAIQADNEDEQSYSERAKIFEEFGEIDAAISDLERVLALSTRESGVDATRQRIERLRKKKE